MGSRHTSYEVSLTYLDLEELSNRRENLCLTFALKCLKNEKFKHFFQPTPELEYGMRNERRKFLEPQCDRERYRKSPLVYMTRLLNQYFDQI